MNRSEWTRTPYAKTTARNPEGAISSLFLKYDIQDFQFSRGLVSGIPTFQVRFMLNDKPYRIRLAALDAENVSGEEKSRQIMRAVWHYLKSIFEMSEVFITPEQALFSFLELPTGETVHEVAERNYDALEARSIAGFLGDGEK